MNFTVA